MVKSYLNPELTQINEICFFLIKENKNYRLLLPDANLMLPNFHYLMFHFEIDLFLKKEKNTLTYDEIQSLKQKITDNTHKKLLSECKNFCHSRQILNLIKS